MKIFKIVILFLWMSGISASLKAQSPSVYLVSDFYEEELGQVLWLCHQAGFEYLLHRYPFSTYGHYEWNPSFAKKGDRSVVRMVNEAAEEGVHLGVFAQVDAVSVNDSYFSPPYYSQLLRQGQVRLLDDLTADQTELTVYKSEVFNTPSTLNLLLMGEELLSYGTLEPVGDLLLLHHCNRGLYGTMSAAHRASESVYKLWILPSVFVRLMACWLIL